MEKLSHAKNEIKYRDEKIIFEIESPIIEICMINKMMNKYNRDSIYFWLRINWLAKKIKNLRKGILQILTKNSVKKTYVNDLRLFSRFAFI